MKTVYTTKQAQGFAGLVENEPVKVQGQYTFEDLRESRVWDQIATDVDALVEAGPYLEDEVWSIYKYVDARVAEANGVNVYFALPESYVEEILA